MNLSTVIYLEEDFYFFGQWELHFILFCFLQITIYVYMYLHSMHTQAYIIFYK